MAADADWTLDGVAGVGVVARWRGSARLATAAPLRMQSHNRIGVIRIHAHCVGQRQHAQLESLQPRTTKAEAINGPCPSFCCSVCARCEMRSPPAVLLCIGTCCAPLCSTMLWAELRRSQEQATSRSPSHRCLGSRLCWARRCCVRFGSSGLSHCWRTSIHSSRFQSPFIRHRSRPAARPAHTCTGDGARQERICELRSGRGLVQLVRR